MRRPPRVLLAALAFALPALASALDAERPAWQLELEQIMANPDWIGPPVESPFWSLDGAEVFYALRRAESSYREGATIRDLWRVAADGGEPQPVADAERAALDAAAPVFDRERRRALIVRDGDIFLRELQGERALRRLSRTPAGESSPQWRADGEAVQWRVGNDWFEHDLASGLTAPLAALKAEKDPKAPPDADALRDMQLRLISTLAREKAQREAFEARQRELRAADPQAAAQPIYLGDGVSISDVRLSPDGRWMLAVTTPKSADRGRVGKMPMYVTESGYEEAEDVRTRVGRNLPAAQSLHLVDLASGEVKPLDLAVLPGIDKDPLADLRAKSGAEPLEGLRAVSVFGVRFSADGTRLAVMLRANDNKDRWIAEVDFSAAKLQPRHRLTDPAWISYGSSDNSTFNEFGWLPDGGTLWYLSEETGYSHLYTLAAGGKPRALTSGRWEASRVAWSADGGTAYLSCNRAWPGDYELCAVDRESGALRELTALDAVEEFVLSPQGDKAALLVSQSHVPPQLAVLELASGEVKRLTDTRSAAYRARSFPAPQFVQVPSKHGAGTIWGKLYRPAQLEPGKRYPIALFVHGAGYLQNVIAGWPPYFREQMFHHLLVEQGYLVLDLDFRGSAGYGRDWRTAIYRQMGHPELEDYLDGIDWLVETQQGDRGRVGVYGGSYGGFMAFMAMFRAPEAFHAGAALRPVTDWVSYNHGYTANILNTPDIDPEAYAKSSPIEYAQHLRGHLLISHGMIDDNVLYQDSVRLAQRLIELRKDKWELASYPLERHGYVHPESWYDQYRRIFELFERALKP